MRELDSVKCSMSSPCAELGSAAEYVVIGEAQGMVRQSRYTTIPDYIFSLISCRFESSIYVLTGVDQLRTPSTSVSQLTSDVLDILHIPDFAIFLLSWCLLMICCK